MKRVEKPWGHEMIWAVTDRYVGKVLHIKAGHKLSLQYHRQKDETVMVWSGRMLSCDAAAAPPHDRRRGHRRLRGLDHRARRRRPPRRRLRPQGHLLAVALRSPLG